LGLDDAARVVITLARLCPQKNLAATVQAMALLKSRNSIADLHCLVCGEGEERAALEASVEELGLKGIVHFLGARTDVPSLLDASDAYLSTSLHEGMPLSVLEALSAGLPCLLSRIPEHYELAESMPGCTFVSDGPLVVEALESVLRSAPDKDQLRRQRATLLEKHSIARCAELYHHLYEGCCGPALQPHLARS
jgi:glycosyltransferase involved in cell wall biosynthesis